QHAAFDSANRARRDELARKAGEELVRLGERLSDAAPVTDDPGATGELRKALDVHAAARRGHDALPDTEALVDIVGVLALPGLPPRRSTAAARAHSVLRPSLYSLRPAGSTTHVPNRKHSSTSPGCCSSGTRRRTTWPVPPSRPVEGPRPPCVLTAMLTRCTGP